MTKDDDYLSTFGNGGSSEPTTDQALSTQATDPEGANGANSAKEPRLPMTRAMVVTILLLVFVALMAIAAVVVANTIGQDFDWEIWEYVIGIGGGIGATILVGLAIFWLDEKNILEYTFPVIILTIGLSILNFVLRCYYADEEYKIIFICFGILLSGLCVYYIFHLIDIPLIIAQAIGSVFSIAFLISGWIMPEWAIWQWIIGGLVSLLFVALIFALERNGEFIRYAASLFLMAILLGVNFVLFRKYDVDYKTIFICVSASAMLASVISIAFRHQKGDGAWGKVSIVPLVAGAVLLLVGLLAK